MKQNKWEEKEFKDSSCSVPLGVLSIASFLEEKGISVKILDERLFSKKDFFDLLEEELKKDILCVGFSLMTAQIKQGLEIMNYVKNKDKKIPIILGGIHPTLYPSQTCKNKYVDYVIQGEGEYSFYELLMKLKRQQKIDNIKGLVYKKNGKIYANSLQDPLDINDLPFPSFHLLDVERYIDRLDPLERGRVRCLDVPLSRGCPYRCSFCTNTLSAFKKWRPLKIEKVIELIDSVIKKYNLNYIWFRDDYFFGNTERVKQIAKHIIKKGYKIKWAANPRANDFDKKLDDETLELIKKSGCDTLLVGMESGSERILKILSKDITVDQIKNAVKKSNKHGIHMVGAFMCGIPGETNEEVIETVKLIFYLKSTFPYSCIGFPGILRPYPGCELYLQCKKLGFKEPNSMEEWANKKIEFEENPKEMPYVTDPCWLLPFLNFVSIISLVQERKEKKFFLNLLSRLLIFRFNMINKNCVGWDLKFLLKFRKFLYHHQSLKSKIRYLLVKR